MKQRKRREYKEKVSKKFLMSLLEPYYPTLKPGEEITDLSITTHLEEYVFNYIIMGGGVKDSKELSKGDSI
jgi:hypothetical protein